MDNHDFRKGSCEVLEESVLALNLLVALAQCIEQSVYVLSNPNGRGVIWQGEPVAHRGIARGLYYFVIQSPHAPREICARNPQPHRDAHGDRCERGEQDHDAEG